MTPQVAAVLQNLVPIVDNGQTAPDATYHDTHIWGATLGANTVVARSGHRRHRHRGPGLRRRSGPHRPQPGRVAATGRGGTGHGPRHQPGMGHLQLLHPPHRQPVPDHAAKLYPQMQRPADRYLGPTAESRDFFMVSIPA